MQAVEKWLRKKAKGFHYRETVEEFQDDGGELRLVRKKVSTKYMPPDVAAIRAIGEAERTLAECSDDELERMRDELIAKRRQYESNDD